MELFITDIIRAKIVLKITPLVLSDGLSGQLSSKIYFKLENLQKQVL